MTTPPPQDEQVAAALQNELEKLGIDITTEQGRDDFRKTMFWAKQNRQRCEKASTGIILIVLGGVLTVLGSWLMSGFQKFVDGGMQ